MKRVKAVQFRYQQTYRSLSSQVGIPTTTLHRLLKAGVLQKSTSAVKPMLTDANKVRRVGYCELFIESDWCFGDILDRVDIDEKWWYITRVNMSYIIVEGEVPPDQKVKHKSHIIKVMCLTAMARPCQNTVTKECGEMERSAPGSSLRRSQPSDLLSIVWQVRWNQNQSK